MDTVLRGYGIIASPGLLVPDNDLYNPDVEAYDEVQVVHVRDLPTLPLHYADSCWAHNGAANMCYTKRGIAMGTPIAQNKQSFVK